MKLTAIIIILLTIWVFPAFGETITTLSKSDINFGYVPQNAVFKGTITVRSNVNYEFAIDKILTFCDCLELSLESETIQPFDSMNITVTLNTKKQSGWKHWKPAIYDKTGTTVARFGVMAHIIPDINSFKPLRIIPPVINASQFGDKGQDEYTLEVINTTDETIPLKLLDYDATYYDLDFPVYVEPNKKAQGKITLNEKGKTSSFVNSITFEFIDAKSEKNRYSISITRKIYKPQSN
jgi:hypothetical protein